MILNSDSDIAKEDKLMMPHYKTATDIKYCTIKYITYTTEIVFDLENKLELWYYHNVKARNL